VSKPDPAHTHTTHTPFTPGALPSPDIYLARALVGLAFGAGARLARGPGLGGRGLAAGSVARACGRILLLLLNVLRRILLLNVLWAAGAPACLTGAVVGGSSGGGGGGGGRAGALGRDLRLGRDLSLVARAAAVGGGVGHCGWLRGG